MRTSHLLQLSRPLFRQIPDLKPASYGFRAIARDERVLPSSRKEWVSLPPSLLRISKELQFTEAKYKNFCYSPCSIQLAMSLIANGAKGSTLEELLTFTNVNNLNQLNRIASNLVDTLTNSTIIGRRGPKLSFVGGVWLDKLFALKPEFRSIAENVYNTKAETVDFRFKAGEVVHKVNEWAADATNGLIKNILQRDLVDGMTRMVLANAVYFKGKWVNPFEKSDTYHYDFHLLNGSSVRVPFMTNSEDKQYIKTCDDCKILRLPYKSCTLSMYIILPHAKDGLFPLAEKVGTEPMFLEKFATRDIELVKVGKFKVPKFKITYAFEASMVLEALGLKTCFSREADFNEMIKIQPDDWLEIGGVHQKTYIEVYEEGTEAAAVTVTRMAGGSCARPKRVPRVDFVADHPFMFAIRDDVTGMVLFMGHVINPLR